MNRIKWKGKVCAVFFLFFVFFPILSYSKVQEKPVFSEETLAHWDQATFPTAHECAFYHWQKHASYLGKSPEEYTSDALDFFKREKERARPLTLKNGERGFIIRTGPGGPGGYFTQDGRVVSFWYEYSRKRR